MRESVTDETSELPVRDQLALERTKLANERTLLAYVRTALALGGAGAAVIHIFPQGLTYASGWALIVAGTLTLLTGTARFAVMQRRLSQESTTPTNRQTPRAGTL